MFHSFFKSFSISIFSATLILLLFFCSFVPLFSEYDSFESSNSISYTTILSSNEFLWPTPGYTTITSYFGRRNAPTSGASTSHSGIDIAAPTGSNIVAVCSGSVTFLGFSGAGGYTITIKNETFSASYCHVSPDFLVSVGQKIRKGQVIGKVGPKNVYGVPNNPYRDKSGNPTNGATTGPHLHLTLRKSRRACESFRLPFLKVVGITCLHLRLFHHSHLPHHKNGNENNFHYKHPLLRCYLPNLVQSCFCTQGIVLLLLTRLLLQ